MKKPLLRSALLIVLLLFVVACSKNDDSDNPGDTPIGLTSADYTPDGYFDGVLYYQITSADNHEAEISKCKSSAKEVQVPDNIIIDREKYVISALGAKAFYTCSALTSVEIPNGVTSIGRQAFYGCSGLTSVEIPDGVTIIGDCASGL